MFTLRFKGSLDDSGHDRKRPTLKSKFKRGNDQESLVVKTFC